MRDISAVVVGGLVLGLFIEETKKSKLIIKRGAVSFHFKPNSLYIVFCDI